MRWNHGVLAILLLAFWTGVASAEFKKGKVELTDGRKLEGMLEVQKNGDVVYKKYGSKFTFKKRNVVVVIFPDEPGGKKPKAGGAKKPDQPGQKAGQLVDYFGRFVLDAPDGWEILRSQNPAIRGGLKHTDEDSGGFLYVSVAPFPGEYPDAGGSDRGAGRLIGKRAKDDFAAVFPGVRGRGPNTFKTGELFQTPVFQAEYTADSKKVIELRFGQSGFEYALRAGCDSAKWDKYKDAVWRALESFSFVPSIESSPKHFLDFRVGFLVGTPGDGWVLESDVFNEEMPVRMRSPKGDAWVKVEIKSGNISGTQMLDSLIRTLKSRPGAKVETLTNGDGKRDGCPIIFRRVSGYEEGGVTAKEFYYFIANKGDALVLISGLGPSRGEDSEELRSQLMSFFDGVRVFSPDVAREQLSKTSRAVDDFAAGMDAYSRKRYSEAASSLKSAVEAFPEFVRALMALADCYKEMGEVDKATETIGRIKEIDPENEKALALEADAYWEAATKSYQDKDYAGSAQNLKLALKGLKKKGDEKSLEDARKFGAKLFKEWIKETQSPKTEKAFKKAVDVAEDGRKLLRDEKADERVAEAWSDLGGWYEKAGKLRRAKRSYEKGLKEDKGNKRVAGKLRSLERKLKRN